MRLQHLADLQLGPEGLRLLSPPAAAPLEEPEVVDIVARAATLGERLRDGFRPAHDPGGGRQAARRLEAWVASAARGDRGAFARRLAVDGWTDAGVLPLLGPVWRPPERALPSWTGTFRAAMGLSKADVARSGGGAFQPDDPLPFEEAVAPFLIVGRHRLAARTPEAERGLLEPVARAGFERLLLHRLSTLASRALHVEFSVERSNRTTSLGRLLALGSGEPARGLYVAFVTDLLDGGLRPFFGHYPVLARLMSRVTDLWVEATAELLGRLRRDGPDLDAVFGGGGRLGPVVTAEPGLSDPHHGGRAVARLAFASGVTLAYKPKDVGTEGAFNRLLAWIDEREPPLPLRVTTTLVRPSYGWAEWVQHGPCRSEDEVSAYYRRAGMLACLVYALAGTDCHRENLVASGPDPVLVDTESLMHHRALPPGPVTGVQQAALDELVSGVLGTGLLPNWELDEAEDGPPTDISALHTADSRELSFRTQRWQYVNTDRMALREGTVTIPPPRSQPLLASDPVRLEDHAEDLLLGFQGCYELLVRHREALLAPGAPLDDLAAQQVRFIYRNTRVYGSLHHELTDPEYLRDGVDRSIRLESLARALNAPPDPSVHYERWWPVFRAECQAMEEMDVPFFSARADGARLTLGPGAHVDGCLSGPSAELVRDRVGSLGPQDMRRQLGFMAGSLHSDAARHDVGDAPHHPAGPVPGRAGPPPPTADFDAIARRIAADLADRAIRSADGAEATWIAPQYLPRLERYQLQPVAHDLHSGACGIGLFLAATARVTGDAAPRQLALASVQPLRDALARNPAALASAFGHGCATGTGSIVYGLTRIATLLDEPALLADAIVAATQPTLGAIDRAPPDVFSGLAGDILGLVSLHSATGHAGVRQRAVACGRRLTGSTRPGLVAGAAWTTLGGRQLTGFSHGAAGIAYALLRLHRVAPDPTLVEAAARAIEHEDSLFDDRAGNWPDLREETQPAFKSQWCHGAPGIGLARVGGLGELDTPRVRADIDAALRTTLSTDVAGPDHLCCGNLGRADLLLTAGRRLGRPDLVSAARQRVAEVAGRAATTGRFRLHSSLPSRVHMPGLFMGMAGVGYQLLRTAHPSALPSVLLWD